MDAAILELVKALLLVPMPLQFYERPRKLPAALVFTSQFVGETARLRLGYQPTSVWDWVATERPPAPLFWTSDECVAHVSQAPDFVEQRRCEIRTTQLVCFPMSTEQPRRATLNFSHIDRCQLDKVLAKVYKYCAEFWPRFASNGALVMHTSCLRAAAMLSIRPTLLSGQESEIELLLAACFESPGCPVTVAFYKKPRATEQAVYCVQEVDLRLWEYVPSVGDEAGAAVVVRARQDEFHRRGKASVCGMCAATMEIEADLFCCEQIYS